MAKTNRDPSWGTVLTMLQDYTLDEMHVIVAKEKRKQLLARDMQKIMKDNKPKLRKCRRKRFDDEDKP